MKTISLYCERKKHKRRKKWRERKTPKEQGIIAGRVLNFTGMVRCKLCGSEIPFSNLKAESHMRNLKSLGNHQTRWLYWYYWSGWERVRITIEGKGFKQSIKEQYYICGDCREDLGECRFT